MISSGLLCGLVIWKRTPILIPGRESWQHLRPMIWEELKVGVPMGIQFSVIAFGFMVLQYVLNSFGSIAVAAFTVGSRVQSLMINPIAAMGVVMATYVGQNFGAKKWDRIETYGPKLVENIIQAISRDILAHAMANLRNYSIVGHIHDELIIECTKDTAVHEICQQMVKTPIWLPNIKLRAEGYSTKYYRKD